MDGVLQLVETFPDPTGVPLPARPRLSPKKKRSVLASLTRTLSPRRNGTLASFREADRKQRSTSSTTLQSLSATASALTVYSRSANVREHAAWTSFFSARREDLHSVRIERRITRYRSDHTLEVSRNPNPEPFSVASTPEADTTAQAARNRRPSTTDPAAVGVDAHPLSLVLDAQFARDVEELLAAHTDEGAPDLPSTMHMDISTISHADSALSVPHDEPVHENQSTTPVEGVDIPALIVHRAPIVVDTKENIKAAAPDDAQPELCVPSASVVPQHSQNERSPPYSATSEGNVGVSGPGAPMPELPTPLECVSSGMTLSASGYSTTTTSHTIERRSRSITLDSFERMRVLGKGCAGKVLLVREKRTGQLMALKAITKRHVSARDQLRMCPIGMG